MEDYFSLYRRFLDEIVLAYCAGLTIDKIAEISNLRIELVISLLLSEAINLKILTKELNNDFSIIEDKFLCSICNKYKDFCEIHGNPLHFSDKILCKNCRYKKDLIKKFNVTFDEIDTILNSKRCAICNSDKKLVVDHNHITGRIRGLLCNQCNIGLGLFKDKIENLSKAINYLKLNQNEDL